MKKIGIIGKDSFIGSNLFEFLSKNPNYSVIGTTIETLNITDTYSIADFIKKEKCDVIILLAGSKNVKELENNPNFGYKINVEPVKNLIRNITQEKLIYFSSDYVFDGQRGKYIISDIVCPSTVYGKNKAEAEKIIQNSGINYTIVRTAAVLGNKSVFLNWLLEILRKENQVEMYESSYFSPTCVNFLCKAIDKIINEDCSTIHHVVQEKNISRYDLACIIKKLVNSECKIIPIKANREDRTLAQDDFVKKITDKPFEEYLKEILCIK